MYARQDVIVSLAKDSPRFLGLERRNCSLTNQHTVCRRCSVPIGPLQFFSVSTLSSLTGKPLLSGLSSLSSLHPQDLPAVPGSVTFRQLLSPASWLPTPAHVERSTRDRTPWADLWQFELPRTDFEHDGLSITQKVCPRRPLSVRKTSNNLSDRTMRLLAWYTKPFGLLH